MSRGSPWPPSGAQCRCEGVIPCSGKASTKWGCGHSGQSENARSRHAHLAMRVGRMGRADQQVGAPGREVGYAFGSVTGRRLHKPRLWTVFTPVGWPLRPARERQAPIDTMRGDGRLRPSRRAHEAGGLRNVVPDLIPSDLLCGCQLVRVCQHNVLDIVQRGGHLRPTLNDAVA